MSISFRPMRATCFAGLIFLDLVNLILYGDDYKSWSSLSSNFVLPSVTSSVFEPSIFLYICTQHPQPMFFLYCATLSFMSMPSNGQNQLCTFRSPCFQSACVKALDSEAQGIILFVIFPLMKCISVLPIYRMFHDLWTLLQEVISWVFVIKKVHINMCPILDGYGVMTAWNLE